MSGNFSSTSNLFRLLAYLLVCFFNLAYNIAFGLYPYEVFNVLPNSSIKNFGAPLQPPFGGSVCRGSSEPQTSHQERWSEEYRRGSNLSQGRGDG